jgi:hypothetical protein
MKKSPATKGHWAKGRRRNADTGSWSSSRLKIAAILGDYHCRGKVSYRAFAKAVGVDDRTARRWLAGIHRPTAASQVAAKQWIKEILAEIKSR